LEIIIVIVVFLGGNWSFLIVFLGLTSILLTVLQSLTQLNLRLWFQRISLRIICDRVIKWCLTVVYRACSLFFGFSQCLVAHLRFIIYSLMISVSVFINRKVSLLNLGQRSFRRPSISHIFKPRLRIINGAPSDITWHGRRRLSVFFENRPVFELKNRNV